jgi:hypothetical protein
MNTEIGGYGRKALHCGVFGRCIAGTWRTGNMLFFNNVIILMAVAGFVTPASRASSWARWGSSPPHVRHPTTRGWAQGRLRLK